MSRRGALLGVAASAVLAACQLVPLGPRVDCGQVSPDLCAAMVEELLAEARAVAPDQQVVSIVLSTPNGGYYVEFADGTGFGVTP